MFVLLCIIIIERLKKYVNLFSYYSKPDLPRKPVKDRYPQVSAAWRQYSYNKGTEKKQEKHRNQWRFTGIQWTL